MALFWIIIAVIFAIIDGLTLSMVTIWFSIGAILSAIVSLAGGNIRLQIIVFFVFSILLIILARPILVKRLKVGREKNIIESLEGKSALITEAITPFSSGLAKVNGIVWTAVGETPETSVDAGKEVRIIRVEGVKLIVTPIS
jgi:membrane protein implicated in regulation of membrane protease activity